MIWSGNNTAHEAVACGLPIVTLPGRMMRGRHCLAILQRLGLTDTIANDMEDYVQIAVKLARDRKLREHLRAETLHRKNRIFDDSEPILALEKVIPALCSGGDMSAFRARRQQIGGIS
jgi:predicted O-linked N-acetylglucosamine transferase (SPINDLY family)